MRRPYNHAVINKLRATYVGLESEMPSVLREGDTFFATDTYKLYTGGIENTDKPFAVKGFPYHLMVECPNGTDVFRFFLDPVNGNDDNTGLKWSQAKKTLSAIHVLLPLDLKDNSVYIYMQSGTCTENVNTTFNNGKLFYYWCGTFINAATDDWSMFMKADENNPIRDDEQIIFKSPDDTKDTFVIGGTNLLVELKAFNHNFQHYVAGYCFYDRIVLEDADTLTANQHNYVFAFYPSQSALVLVGVTFKVIGSHTAAIYGYPIHGGMAGIKFDTTEAIGEVVTSTSVWRGLAMLRGSDPVSKFGFGKASSSASTYVKYDDTYKPTAWLGGSDAQIIIDGECKNLWTNGASPCNANYVDLDANDLIYEGGGTPRIMCSSDFEGTINYTSASMTLVDASTHPRVIKDYTTGIETIYLTNGIQQAGANVIFDLTTSDPSVAGALWNDSGTVKVSAG